MKRLLMFMGAVLLLAGPAASKEYVYFSLQPGTCFYEAGSGTNCAIYVDSGEYADVSGVSFRLDTEAFGAGDYTVEAPPGVTIVSGDLLTGIVLSCGARSFAHEPVLLIHLSSPLGVGAAWTRDVSLKRGAVSVPEGDFGTYGHPVDCYGTFANWDAPDTVAVDVDKDDEFSFRSVVTTGSYPPDATLSVVDGAGWVMGPVSESVFAGCGWCDWDWTTVTVPTHLPSNVGDGQLNPVILRMTSYGGVVSERTLVLKAVRSVRAERRTIGAVKAMYR